MVFFKKIKVFRVLLGIGEAFNAPACYALITLYFPHFKRATANGIYSTGTYLGSAMSSLCLAIAVGIGEIWPRGVSRDFFLCRGGGYSLTLRKCLTLELCTGSV